MRVSFHKLLLVLALLAGSASWAPPVLVETRPYFLDRPRTARVVTIGEQRPERSSLLQIDDDREWRRTMLFGRPERYAPAKGVLVMIPGMGGNVVRYGVAGSTTTFANVALQLGYYPVSVQNRVYYGAAIPGFPEAERRRIAEELKDLDTQMREYYATLEALRPAAEKELWVFGRSNGAALTLEWLHRACLGDAAAMRIAEGVDGVLVAGLNSHVDPGFRLWTSIEDAENLADPGDDDPIARFVDRENYRRMGWASDGPAIVNARQARFPKVIAIIAAQDKYVPVSVQVATMEAFSRRHPQLVVELLFTPTRHDPTASFTVWRLVDGVRTEVRVSNGKVVKEILRNHLHREPGAPGLHRVTFPDFENAPRCPELLEHEVR